MWRHASSIAGCPKPGKPVELTVEVNAIIDERMAEDDETSAYQLHHVLKTRGYDISLAMILRCRSTLSWTF